MGAPVRALKLFVVVALVLLSGCRGQNDSLRENPQNVSGQPAGPGGITVDEPPAAAGSSLVAEASVPRVSIFKTPNSGSPIRSLPNPLDGAPLVFLVDRSQGDWLFVNLPVRPNGSKGWIKKAEVVLRKHTFRITIDLSDHRLTVHQGDTVILDEPAGIGTKDTPTPEGIYYTKRLIQPPNPNGAFGPFVYELSGFSNVLTDFLGGDGVVGIHGTNRPEFLGKDVSHGCIRISNAGITKLSKILPLGVPVDIRP
jgi:lipoprotein-anchoring transpeptidase ErfK/SrfK